VCLNAKGQGKKKSLVKTRVSINKQNLATIFIFSGFLTEIMAFITTNKENNT
jgi:hypothetical protein